MRKFFLLLIPFFITLSGVAQTDTLLKKLDSLSKKTDSAGEQINNTLPADYNLSTQFTPGSFVVLQLSNLKQAFTKPFHMSGKDWRLFGEFALATGALAFADEPIQRFALNLRNHNQGMHDVSRTITNFGGLYEGYTLGALGAYGFLFKNKKMQTTTLLALQSYITGAAVESVVKFVTGRQRPYAVDATSVEAEPAFRGPFKILKDANGNKLNSSFPSGHTTVAFAAATVYALEYKNKPWVPVLCYTSASLIGLSRITENKHWATDVLVGAALGYLTGRQVVNNYHRYAKLKAPKQRTTAITFSMGYEHGVLMPSVVYKF